MMWAISHNQTNQLCPGSQDALCFLALWGRWEPRLHPPPPPPTTRTSSPVRSGLLTHIVLRLQIDLRSYQQLQTVMIATPNCKHSGCLAILHTNKQTNTRRERDRVTERQTGGDKKGGKQAKTAKKKERLLTRKAAHIFTA